MDEAPGRGPGFAAHRRWRALLALAAAAVLAHLTALSGVGWAWPRNEPASGASRPVQLRAVAEVSVPAAEVPGPALRAPVPDEPRGVPVRPRRAVGELRSAPARAAAETTPIPEPAVAAPAAIAEAAVEEDLAPPSYRTIVPPSADLHYQVRRGRATGTAELRWRVDGARYELGLQTRLDGDIALAQSSEGDFDAAGVAPLRFVDRRGSRAAAAANFQRDTGRITFSRKAAAVVLRPGSQDRLSWMLQLPSIVGADGGLREPGAEVLMNVASAGGDVAVWAFRCQGREALPTAAGDIDSLRYVREPRGPYDTRVEVWLDPGRQYLPVRLEWKSGPADDGFALRLPEAAAAP